MQRTRRGLLGVGAAAVVGLSGCLGVEGVEYPDAAAEDPPNADGGDDGGGDGGETAGDEQVDGDDPEPVANEALATATRNVVDDAVWFATEYPSAVATYRDAIREVVAEIDDVRDAVDENDAVTVEMADRLDEAGRTAADTAADALEPQFHPRFRIVVAHGAARREAPDVRPRGDVDRFLEELSRMRRGFAAVGTATYVDEAFSREPIHNRLLNRLLYPLPDDDAERRRVRGEAFVELGLASRGFSAFAHEPYDDEEHDRNQIPRIYGNAFEAARREELRARLGPIPRSEDRTEELFVAFATRPAAGNRPSRTFEGGHTNLRASPCTCSGIRTRRPRTIGSTRAVAAASTGRARRSTPTPPRPDPISPGTRRGGRKRGRRGAEATRVTEKTARTKHRYIRARPVGTASTTTKRRGAVRVRRARRRPVRLRRAGRRVRGRGRVLG